MFLHWDGILPEAPKNSILTPDDAVHFWPHLTGFARWWRSKNAFILSFSKQNTKRIYNQFGKIPIRSGRERLEELKQRQSLCTEMVQKALKIKELPYDRLPTYQYKLPPIGEYQHRGVVFLCNVDRAPLFADCGMGKTFMVLVSTEIQIQKGILKPGKTLICGKLATLETGWLEDASKFTNLKVSVLWEKQGKNRKKKILDRLNEPADVYLINHDGVRVFQEELAAAQFDKIVVDESTILKGFRGTDPRIRGGQLGKALMHVAQNARYRVVMSGTPAPNGPEDLWGQFFFLDPDGLFLEPNFNDFRQEYYKIVDLRSKDNRFLKNKQGEFVKRDDGSLIAKPLGPKDPKKWEPKKDAVEKISEIVGKPAYRLKLRDHIKDMPELTVVKRFIDMSPEQSAHYDDMRDRLKVEIDNERITASLQITAIMKLRQITGGFIIDHEGKAHSISQNPKLDELDSLINEEISHEEKVVIYCEYQWEVKTICERYKKYGVVSVYGGNTSSKNLANIKKFIEDQKTRLIVLHPKSAAHGITFTMAHYMVFYSFSHSSENNYQCIRRIERKGQKNAMFVYYLACNKSIDRDILNVVKVKDEQQSRLIDPNVFSLFNQSDIDDQILAAWRKDERQT